MDIIAQAEGILVHRNGLDADQAFATLVDASQHADMKLRDVAAWFVEPGSGARPGV